MKLRNGTASTGLWIWLGLLIIALVFGGLGAWAALVNISGAVIARGAIEVESKIKTIQHLKGGIVGEIFVKEGDHVKRGDPLVLLDETDARAELGIVQGRLDEQAARLARLKAERDGREAILFARQLTDRTSEPELAAILNGQRSLFAARKSNREGQVQILGQKSKQLESQQRAATAKLGFKQKQAEIQTRIVDRKLNAATGSISHDARDTILQKQVLLNSEIEDIRSEIASIDVAVGENKLRVLQIEKDFHEKILAEISETRTRIGELRERKQALAKNLKLVRITAPLSGRVYNMTVSTIGGVVSPGMAIMQLVPDNDSFIVRTRVTPLDVDQVVAGKKARVHLSSFDPRTTPALNGTVRRISPAQKTDKATGQSYYHVDIKISVSELRRLEKDQKLIPGMPAEVYIRTSDRTPLEYFLQPLIVQFRRAFKEPV